LTVEVDGNYHKSEEAREYDKARTVLRFWNEDVIKEIEKVLEKIACYL
jgi:very-short-patch-repair endonuclease